MPSVLRGRMIWAAVIPALFLASTTMAFQGQAKPPAKPPVKDADLPPDVAKLPFEIRDGYRRFTKRCTACHDRKRVDAASKSLFDWQGTIGSMSFKQGANIPQEDRHSIFIYLAYLHGTKGNAQQKDEYTTFLTKCEDCHGISLVYKDKKPLKEWPALIHRMAVKGRAKISVDDEKKIMGYINRMYPDVFGVE